MGDIRDAMQEPPEVDAEAAKRERQIHRLKAELAESKGLLKHAHNELLLADKRYDALASIKEPVAVMRYKPPKRTKSQVEFVVAGAIASDWHFGEAVDLGQTNGLNEYDPEIAEARALRFFDRIVWLCDLHRAGRQMDTFVLALLGDLMTGFIHEDLRQTNHLGPLEEIRELKRVLITGIDYLLEQDWLKCLLIPCVWGNHGRINYDREMISAGRRNSYEAGLYMDLADHYKDEERVVLDVADGPLLYVPVEGFTIRTTHGNSFGYQGGIGGLSIPLIKACYRWDQGIPADLTLMGHWHTYLDIGHAIINGTNKGTDPFSQKKGFPPEPAQQAFFLLDPRSKRRTGGAPIFVEPPEEWLERRTA